MPANPHTMTRRTACKTVIAGAMACASGIDEPALAAGQASLARTTPELAGVSPDAIERFIDAVNVKVGGLHSVMLLRHGAVVAEGWWAPYARQYPHMLYSLSKSFTSTAVGLAVTQVRLTVDAPVTSFFPDQLPAQLSDNLKAMQVRHLLSMSTGHHVDALGATTAAPDGDWVKAFLAIPVQHEPGTYFVYNSAASYMLSAIVQKITGKTALQFLTPLLFKPLGITGPTWETCPRGINCGGWGLSIKTEDIARFGQLYLQKGKWEGRQLLPEPWVTEATSRHISNGNPAEANDWTQGYCYQFWRCRHNAFRGDGAFGQFCVVMPEQDIVLAITSGIGDMQAVLNAAWEQLLPGVLTTGITAAGADTLTAKLARLEVKPPSGKRSSPVSRRISGRTYHLETNSLKLGSISTSFAGDSFTAALSIDGKSFHIRGGYSSWAHGEGCRAKSTSALPGLVSNRAAGRGAWIGEDTYQLMLCYYETPYIDTLTFTFTGTAQIAISLKSNVGFGPTSYPDVVGHTA